MGKRLKARKRAVNLKSCLGSNRWGGDGSKRKGCLHLRKKGVRGEIHDTGLRKGRNGWEYRKGEITPGTNPHGKEKKREGP